MITWSHTRLADYLQCPFKYREKYITKSAKVHETEAMRNGNTVHKILEDATDAPDLAATPTHALLDWVRVRPFVERVRAFNGVAELQLGVRRDWSPCGFWDDGVYGRCKIDELMTNDKGGGIIIDWKTSKLTNKKYQTNAELKLHAVIAQAHFPELKSINGVYVYTRDGSTWPESTMYNLSDFAGERKKVDELCRRIEFATTQDRFTTRKNNLCPWCEVKHCKHHKPKE